jgi:hypothetical protein
MKRCREGVDLQNSNGRKRKRMKRKIINQRRNIDLMQ